LNELLDEEEEDEEDPQLVGGQRPQEGHRFQGAQRAPPTSSSMMEGMKPLEGVWFLRIPKKGRWRRAESLRCPWAKGLDRASFGDGGRGGGLGGGTEGRNSRRGPGDPRSGNECPPDHPRRPRSAKLLEERCAPVKVSACS